MLYMHIGTLQDITCTTGTFFTGKCKPYEVTVIILTIKILYTCCTNGLCNALVQCMKLSIRKQSHETKPIDDLIGYCGINIIAYFRGLYAKINTK